MIVLALLLTAAPVWKVVNEAEGVQVFARNESGSKLLSIKGVGVVEASLKTVATVLLDDARLPEWADDVDARVVRMITENEYIEYNHVKMPPLISDREFITNVTLASDPQFHTAVIVSEPAEDPSIPASKHIRGELRAIYEMQMLDATHTRVSVTMYTDPKGSLPAWLVNYFAREWPLSTVRGIRKQCSKKNLVTPKEFEPFVAQLQ